MQMNCFKEIKIFPQTKDGFKTHNFLVLLLD